MLSANGRAHSCELIEKRSQGTNREDLLEKGKHTMPCHLFAMKTRQLAWQGIIFLDNPK